ncbi:MAG: hypothetical protein IT497_02070 [Ottowia sp.]|nr:hypothetical protein [Ottowia sp.]
MFSINRILNSAFSTRTKTLAPEPSPTQRTNMFPPGPTLMCLPNTHTSILIAYKQPQTLPCEKNQPIACTSHTPNAQIDNQITLNHFSATPPRHLCIHDATMSPEKIAPNTSAAEQNNSPKQKKDHSLTPRQKQALKYGFIYPDGSPNLTALTHYRKQNTALRAGFAHPDGSADIAALVLHQKRSSALKRGLTHSDGSPNLVALDQYHRGKTALNAGFTYPDGSPNLTALTRHQKQNTALKHGFAYPDGSANVTQFRRYESKRRAVKAGFVDADGSPDLKAYYRHLNQKSYQRALKAEMAMKK